MWRNFPENPPHLGGGLPSATSYSQFQGATEQYRSSSCLPACESTRSSKPANNWGRVAQTLWETRLMRTLAGLFAFQQAIKLHHECNHFVRVFFHTDSLCDISPITRLWGHGKPPFYFCIYLSYSGSETKSEQFCSPESKLKLGQLGP
jgi:hypothetical protein